MITESKKKFFTHIISNIMICAVIALLALGAGGTALEVMAGDYKPYYSGLSSNVSVMINVYWGTEYIEPILDVLDEYDCKATFFIGGTWAEKNPDLVRLIASKGHEIGNHGYLHKDHKTLTIQQNREEIIITSRLLKSLTGKEVTLFAPPSGSMGNNMTRVCEELNYKIIMWSKDTIDWRDQDYNLIYTRATKNVKSGDFILMHPTEGTLKALPAILSYYKSQGMTSVTVTENIFGNTL